MFVHEELLSIIFRLANFGILVFICVYLFKRYILPTIKDQMYREQEEQHTIKDRHKEIRKQEKIVAAFAYDQEKLCRILQERVNRWRRVQEDHGEKREQEKERRMRFLQDRVMRQEQGFEQQQMLRSIVPRAINTVEHTLQETFKSPEQGHKYTQDIIKQLRKEIA